MIPSIWSISSEQITSFPFLSMRWIDALPPLPELRRVRIEVLMAMGRRDDATRAVVY